MWAEQHSPLTKTDFHAGLNSADTSNRCLASEYYVSLTGNSARGPDIKGLLTDTFCIVEAYSTIDYIRCSDGKSYGSLSASSLRRGSILAINYEFAKFRQEHLAHLTNPPQVMANSLGKFVRFVQECE